MTSRFADRFSRNASPGLLREFGESLVYYPRGVEADARTIVGIVDRQPYSMPSELGGTTAIVELRIRVANDATTGITFAEVDAGSDTVGIPIRPGGALQTRRIIGQPELNGGLVRLRVR